MDTGSDSVTTGLSAINAAPGQLVLLSTSLPSGHFGGSRGERIRGAGRPAGFGSFDGRGQRVTEQHREGDPDERTAEQADHQAPEGDANI